jgi:hypothetical protein
MLHPTLKELLTGLQGTIVQTLIPELTSPYAQNQAMSLMGMLVHAVDSLDKERVYNEGEIKDLHSTIAALKRLEKNHLKRGAGDLKKALASGSKASKNSDRNGMEATMSAFVTALALGKLDAAVTKVTKSWLRRHLDRLTTFLGSTVPA